LFIETSIWNNSSERNQCLDVSELWVLICPGQLPT